MPLGDGLACVVDSEPINWLTPLTSMFLHGSWGHLLGNVLFFWVFGNNIEDSMGPGRFLVFYLLLRTRRGGSARARRSGVARADRRRVGGDLGVMGAYLVLYPRVRVNMLFFFVIFFRVIPMPAWAVLLWWFAMQVVTGLPQLMPMRPEVSGGVAVWAHVGGFVAGVCCQAVRESRLVAKRRRSTIARRAEHPHRRVSLPRLLTAAVTRLPLV